MHARLVTLAALLGALLVGAGLVGCDGRRSGGVELRYRLQTGAATEESENLSAAQVARRRKQTLTTTSDVVNILRRRLHGVDVEVKSDAPGQIVVRLFDVTPATRLSVRRRVEQIGLLEFRAVVSAEGYSQMTDDQRKTVRLMRFKLQKGTPEEPERFEELRIQTRDEYRVTGRMLDRVYRAVDEIGGPAVGFSFTREGGKRFGEMTGALAGKGRIAIILNGQLHGAPRVEERISRRGIIRGRFTEAEVEDLVAVLGAGALPEPLVLVSQKPFGPEETE